jgi:uncharacterized protein (DUF2267 family)
MSNTGLDTFDKSVQQTNQILKDLELQLGWENRRDQTFDLLRISLQALRDRLPVNPAVHLGSELPMLMRGLYYEGWDPDKVPIKINKESFLDNIRREFKYNSELNIEKLVNIALATTLQTVSDDTQQQIREVLPEGIAKLVAKPDNSS